MVLPKDMCIMGIAYNGLKVFLSGLVETLSKLCFILYWDIQSETQQIFFRDGL